MRDPDYSPEMAGPARQARERDLEAAHGEVPLLVDVARRGARADAQPVRAAARQRRVVRRRRTTSTATTMRDVPRLAHPRRHPLRDPPRARLPAPGRLRRRATTAAGRPGSSATPSARPDRGRRRHRLVGRARVRPTRARSRTASSSRRTRPSAPLAAWVLRQNGRAVPLEPRELRHDVTDRLALVRERHEGAAPSPRARGARPNGDRRATGRRGPGRPRALRASSRRSSHTCSPPAARSKDAEIPGAGPRRPVLDPARGARGAPPAAQPRQLRRRLLRGLRRAPRATIVRVDKELYGDIFRSPPRLTPLEARAIRLALEFVGPMIAADAHSPLERVRDKLEETFGQFQLEQRPSRSATRAEERLFARSAPRSASARSSSSST